MLMAPTSGLTQSEEQRALYVWYLIGHRATKFDIMKIMTGELSKYFRVRGVTFIAHFCADDDHDPIFTKVTPAHIVVRIERVSHQELMDLFEFRREIPILEVVKPYLYSAEYRRAQPLLAVREGI